jgi:hypothetical protein
MCKLSLQLAGNQKVYVADVVPPAPIVMNALDEHRELLKEFKDEQGLIHKVKVPFS